MAQARKKRQDKREASNRYSRIGPVKYSSNYEAWKESAKVGSKTAHNIAAHRETHNNMCRHLFGPMYE